MTRVIPVEELPPMDKTAVAVLREISLALGEKKKGYVDYGGIAVRLKISRSTKDERKGRNRAVRKIYNCSLKKRQREVMINER